MAPEYNFNDEHVKEDLLIDTTFDPVKYRETFPLRRKVSYLETFVPWQCQQ
jgi:hypothetical protein